MRRLGPGLLVAVGLWLAPAPAESQPAWWLTVGGLAATDTGRLGNFLKVEGSAFLNGGAHLVRFGPILLGADAEVTGGRVTADLGPADDKISVYRGRVGVRATWWVEHEEPRLVPYGRAGLVLRHDQGNLIKDEGFGWYATLGADWRLSNAWSVGPFATYERVGLSIEAETVLVGIALTYGFE
jgi:hypothetical protein